MPLLERKGKPISRTALALELAALKRHHKASVMALAEQRDAATLMLREVIGILSDIDKNRERVARVLDAYAELRTPMVGFAAAAVLEAYDAEDDARRAAEDRLRDELNGEREP